MFAPFMKRYARFVVALSAIGGLAGCGGVGSGIIGQQEPRIRIFNAVDNQASITVTYRDAGGTSLGTSQGVAFAGVVPQDMIIQNTNATPTVSAGNTALFSGLSSLYRINSVYSVYCGGVPGNYKAIALNDIESAGSTVGSMNVRAVHMGANTAGIDVFIVPASPGGVSGASLFNSLQFGQVTSSTTSKSTVDGNGYVPLAVTHNSSFQVLVTAHNSTVPIARVTAVVNPTVYYTVVIYDSGAGTTGVQILSDRH